MSRPATLATPNSKLLTQATQAASEIREVLAVAYVMMIKIIKLKVEIKFQAKEGVSTIL